MKANLFLKYNIRALGYKTNFSPVPEEWVSPNSKILPETEVRVGTVEDICAESSDIDIDLPDSAMTSRERG